MNGVTSCVAVSVFHHVFHAHTVLLSGLIFSGCLVSVHQGHRSFPRVSSCTVGSRVQLPASFHQRVTPIQYPIPRTPYMDEIHMARSGRRDGLWSSHPTFGLEAAPRAPMPTSPPIGSLERATNPSCMNNRSPGVPCDCRTDARASVDAANRTDMQRSMEMRGTASKATSEGQGIEQI